MAYVICEPCIDVKDKSCIDACPVDCIHHEEGVDRMLFIEPNECIDCSACQPACPVEAIYPEDEVPEAWRDYTELNKLWYEDKQAARARVDELRTPA